MVLNANMTNIKQFFGPEKIPGLSRNRRQATLQGEQTRNFLKRILKHRTDFLKFSLFFSDPPLINNNNDNDNE